MVIYPGAFHILSLVVGNLATQSVVLTPEPVPQHPQELVRNAPLQNPPLRHTASEPAF